MKKLWFVILFSWFLNTGAQMPLLKISSNKRFFQTADGKPFFWLGDTGWLLFVKCNREDAVKYLDTRMRQGFNVIQVMVLHDVNDKNVYGAPALKNSDPSAPATTPGNDFKDAIAYDYWDHVDFIIDEAAQRGIYMALVPVWGSNVKEGKVDVKQAEAYAAFLAARYKSKNNIIWVNGGDIRGDEKPEVWNTIGATLRKNDNRHLITYHPRGRYSSSEWFQKEAWLDFNMFQSGHRTYDQDTSRNEKNHFGEDNWKYVNVDYGLLPVKPVLDGEPSYENIPHGLHDYSLPRWTAEDVRRYAYWSVFAGGAGFTYGENSVMQFHTGGDKDANYGVKKNWKEAINATGAQQMKYLMMLMLIVNGYFDRVPAQEILVDNTGTKYDYLLATKGKKFAMVYSFTGRVIKVDLSKLDFKVSRITWYDPSGGKGPGNGISGEKKITSFTPPIKKQGGNDWVLILE
jgi:hypothetical protein